MKIHRLNCVIGSDTTQEGSDWLDVAINIKSKHKVNKKKIITR